eukprot:3788320-Prymnesium_polylepis.1
MSRVLVRRLPRSAYPTPFPVSQGAPVRLSSPTATAVTGDARSDASAPPPRHPPAGRRPPPRRPERAAMRRDNAPTAP